MQVKNVTPILNVSDVPASIEWFAKLGWRCSFCWNAGGHIAEGRTSNIHGPADFGGVCSGDSEILLCKGAQGHRPGPIQPEVCSEDTGGVWMSWWLDSVPSVDELYGHARKLGYNVVGKPVNEPWGVREFKLRHPDGHTIRVGAGTGEI